MRLKPRASATCPFCLEDLDAGAVTCSGCSTELVPASRRGIKSELKLLELRGRGKRAYASIKFEHEAETTVEALYVLRKDRASWKLDHLAFVRRAREAKRARR